MFKTFFNLFVLMAIYIATKPNVKEDEQQAVESANAFLKSPSVEDAIKNLIEEGFLDEKGKLTRYGITIAYKMGQKPRNARQLNFKRLLSSATPGYTIGMMLTSHSRFVELCEQEIMKYADPKLVDSLIDASASLEHWAGVLESNKLNSVVGDDQTSPIEVKEIVPTNAEGVE